jgi:hypothetical protein
MKMKTNKDSKPTQSKIQKNKEYKVLFEELEKRILKDINVKITKTREKSEKAVEKKVKALQKEEKRLLTMREDILKVKNKIQDHFETQRNKLNSERNQISDKWKKITKMQKELLKDTKDRSIITDKKEDIKSTETYTKPRDDGINKSSSSELFSTNRWEGVGSDGEHELDTRLKDLQAELKSEWSELRSQREKLTSAIEEVTKVRFLIDSNKRLNNENDVEMDETINDSEKSLSDNLME